MASPAQHVNINCALPGLVSVAGRNKGDEASIDVKGT
jgi:hypothetical protein